MKSPKIFKMIMSVVVQHIILLLQVTLALKHVRVPSSSTSIIHKRTSSLTQLYSIGDPDGSEASSNYRKLQKLYRKLDYFIYPHEPDIPGLTFVSPIEWAPWMETIWFGNYYDYRSAFFSDVMYSNNMPCKEGDKFMDLILIMCLI